MHMVESEQDVALEDTDRIEGRSALVNNTNAALALAGAVRSTLGPRGSDKMLVDENGEIVVTNDGVTVLETAKVEHPTANLLIATSSAQDRIARDGTTTSVLLTAELLRNALELSRIGVHPTIIVNGYRIAVEESLSQLEEICRDASDDDLIATTSTTMAGKIDTALAKKMTGLALEAAHALENEEGGDDLERIRVKRLQMTGGGAVESEIIHGLMLKKQRLDFTTEAHSDGGKIAIIDGGFENRELELDAQIEIRSTGVLSGFQDRKRAKLAEQVASLSSLGIDLLCVRDGIADEAVPLLKEAGITAYRRFEREDLERLSILTGAKMVREANRMSAEDVGTYTNRAAEKIDDAWYVRIDGEGRAMTALLRGTTSTMREEVSRAFDDALGVAFRLVREPKVLPGGGGTQTHLARHLRSYATTQKGREQLAIEGFADALEVIPRVLAENAGLDPIDEILALSAAQVENGSWFGLDAMSGEKADMAELGIHDPLFVARQALTGATEAAITVLRIDDVLWANVEPSTPDWSNQIDED